MKIGIISAMSEEVDEVIKGMNNKKEMVFSGSFYHEGTLSSKDVVAVKCGVGKVNASICTQVLVEQFKVDMVINTGVAGAISELLDIGDVVISKDAVYHDMEATQLGFKFGEIPYSDTHIFVADKKLVNVYQDVVQKQFSNKKVVIGTIASGDQFVTSLERKDFIRNNFNAFCVEMEGTAIAHTCYLNRVPFVILRIISDKADTSASINFSEFVKDVSKQFNVILRESLKRF